MNAENKNTTVSQIRQHSRQLVRELDVIRGVYLDSGYTFSQCHVLFELARHGALNLIDLAEQLLIDKSNMSRTVKKLVELGLVKTKKVTTDNRQKLFSLTAKGEKALGTTTRLANDQVVQALKNLDPSQQETVVQGLQLYANALRKSRLQADYSIRLIKSDDNQHVARIIRQVMTEFQAVGDGYSIGDAEVDDMYGAYQGKRSCYYVVTCDGEVVGGGGIAHLKGGGRSVCELRKMFFLSETRGLGLGRQLLLQLLQEARNRDYKQCYLETLDRMTGAIDLYQKNGFKPLDQPVGNTGHCSCDCWFLLDL